MILREVGDIILLLWPSLEVPGVLLLACLCSRGHDVQVVHDIERRYFEELEAKHGE